MQCTVLGEEARQLNTGRSCLILDDMISQLMINWWVGLVVTII